MAILPFGLDVTEYKVIGLPPLETGGEKLTVTCASPAVALTPIGGPGTVIGVTGVTLFDGADDGPVPAAFVAVTVKVYGVPFVSPVTVSGLDGPVAECPPGFDVTVYEMIGLPPSEAGA